MASSIAHVLIFSLVIPFISPSQATTSPPDAIEKICKQYIFYDFCVQVLSSDPGSATADLLGLTKISINLLLRNATDTQALIEALQKNTTTEPPELQTCLSDCHDLYESSLWSINSAKTLVEGGNFTGYVNLYLDGPTDYAALCNDSLLDQGFSDSPLVPRNNYLSQLSGISFGVYDAFRNPGLLNP